MNYIVIFSFHCRIRYLPCHNSCCLVVLSYLACKAWIPLDRAMPGTRNGWRPLCSTVQVDNMQKRTKEGGGERERERERERKREREGEEREMRLGRETANSPSPCFASCRPVPESFDLRLSIFQSRRRRLAGVTFAFWFPALARKEGEAYLES